MARNHCARPARGFTLIEILVVLGIIAVLAAIVIIAINPAKQFAQARDTEREANIEAILNAIGQRAADNQGVFAGAFTIGDVSYYCPELGASTTIYATGYTGTTPPDNAGDLSCLSPTYISDFPADPAQSAADRASGNTKYEVGEDAAGRITVCAPRAADEESIPNAHALCIRR